MIKRIDSVIKRYSTLNPFTNVYGCARAVLALGTFLTLIFNDPETLFFNLKNIPIDFIGIRSIGLFFLLGPKNLLISKAISLIVLFFVIIGWRPRITGILHWWISYSFYSACSIIDGGDQINAILTLLLIPCCLGDNRNWHWENSNIFKPKSIGNKYARLFIWSSLFIIRIQVSVIYFHAAVAKLSVSEWVNGTDTYYWFVNPIHGAAAWLKPLVYYMMSKPVVVVSFTWGTILFELLLAAALFMNRRNYTWKILLFGGVFFHLGIIIIHGLISFFCAMTAALLLYLYPLNRSINLGILSLAQSKPN